MSLAIPIPNIEDFGSNLVLCCESGDIPTLNIGDSVDSWIGKIGSFYQTTPAFKPTYQIDSNGFKYLRFSSSTMYTTTTYLQPSNITIALVYKEISVGNRRYYFGMSKNSQPLEGMAFSNSNIFASSITDQVNGSGQVLSTKLDTVNGYKTLIYTRTSTGVVTLYLNGRLFHKQTITNLSYDPTPIGYSLCRSEDGQRYSCDMYAVYTWHSAISQDKILKLDRYMRFKSGVKF